MSATQPAAAPVARLHAVGLRYGKTAAVDEVSLDIPAGVMVGLIGPDGVGKSSLLALIAGARVVQTGQVEVLGGDIARARHRNAIGPRIAYMPQGLGKNLYPTLSVAENIDFFGRLFGHGPAERARRIAGLTRSTGLAPFLNRPAGKLSGGMKQKLSLCCSLIHDPDLLILDEPTTGVDPLSRRQFWDLIAGIRLGRSDMSVLVATAYMEEAAAFDWLVAMDAGRVLATGATPELLARTGTDSLEEAFIALLPEAKRQGHQAVEIPPREATGEEVAIEARDLTMRFGDFVAVNHVNFRIERGEIFGFLGSNGCGKTTTMKMLTGLLPASEGQAWLFGQQVKPRDLATRRRVGYMTQAFSLYTELTVRQNLELHARLFRLPAEAIPDCVAEMAQRFELTEIIDMLPDALPLGQRQRLSLAVAMIHQPEMLILDEPTSGVDPVARDAFWRIMIDLARRDKVTIFISTHFMNEAERCDRISLMHSGRVLVSDKPAALIAKRGAATLEEAFIGYLEEAAAATAADAAPQPPAAPDVTPAAAPSAPGSGSRRRAFDYRRLFSYAIREALELSRDPIRLAMAGLGSVLLMIVMAVGINMDVDNVPFAVLDRDQSATSRDYTLSLTGSRYLIEQAPIVDYDDLDWRMRAGELKLALEIPSGFERDLARSRRVTIGAWIDGAMPAHAETVRSYAEEAHDLWLANLASRQPGKPVADELFTIATRNRYNPDVKSVVAITPGVIALLLIMIPAILAALSVVREKELGSIINFYVTPVTRLEFLLGKQLPYVGPVMLNFLLLTLLAVTLLGVPLKGSFITLTVATLLYAGAATAMGLFISTFMRSQIAAIFGTTILTMLPATQFSGMIDPVPSLEGMGALIGQIYPTTYYMTIARGVFSKALEFNDLQMSFIPLLLAVLVLMGLSIALLKKQET